MSPRDDDSDVPGRAPDEPAAAGGNGPAGRGREDDGTAADRRPPPDAQERDGPAGDPDAPGGGSRRRSPGPARGRGAESTRRRGGTGARRRGRGEKEKGPSPVGGLVGSIFEKLGIADEVGRAAAAVRWDDVVGPEISRRTGDVRVSGRALIVEVESSTWMQELNMQRHQILRKLNEGIEGGEIEKIVFVQEGGGGRGR